MRRLPVQRTRDVITTAIQTCRVLKQVFGDFSYSCDDLIGPFFATEGVTRRFLATCAATARSTSFWLALLAAFSLAGPLPRAHAVITPTGDVSPTNPSTWDSSTTAYVGYTGTATVRVDAGSGLTSADGYLGYNGGAAGTVTVDGSGSAWNNYGPLYVGYSGSGTLNVTHGSQVTNYSCNGYIGYNSGSAGTVTVDGSGFISWWIIYGGDLYVGNSGSGTLNITNNGSVFADGNTYVGLNAGSTGTINFGTNGWKLTTLSLFAAPSQLTGTGTINTCGLVSDIPLVFDKTHGLTQTITLNSLSGQNVSINLDVTGTYSSQFALGAGWNGAGSLMIKDGLAVNSDNGYLGYRSGSSGTATVSGSGSIWDNYSDFYVGDFGSGTLNITNGGSVSNAAHGYIGGSLGSTGAVTVDGAGSTWTILRSFYVGNSGSGTLNITNGGSVSSSYSSYYNGTYLGHNSAYIGCNSGSTGTVTVSGSGSTWTTNGVYLHVGYSGNGTLNVTDGGSVISSSMTYVGNSGIGTLNITSGGSVTSGAYNGNGYGYIGVGSGSTGAVTVSGSGSTWTNSNGCLYVGYNGSGTLKITNGGSVITDYYGYIGYNSGSTGTVTVDGLGSTWSVRYPYS